MDNQNLSHRLKGNAVVLIVQAQLQQNLQITDIKSYLKQHGYEAWYFLEEPAGELIEKANHQEEGAADISGIIAERRDAELELVVGEDKMQVIAMITTAFGGEDISSKSFAKALQEKQISFGLNKKQILQLIEESASSEPGMTVKGIIAKGREAVPGKSAYLEPLVELFRDREVKPTVQDDGTVDMRDFGRILSVTKGQPIMRKVPKTEGEKGCNVHGEEIDPIAGDDCEIKASEGTVISEKDPNVLLADAMGIAVLCDNGMKIDELLALDKVDISTGHIYFEGCVAIAGDVAEGMKIEAGGDVNITGFVDSAVIQAKGDIIITKAAIGHQKEQENHELEYTTRLSSGGDVILKHAQYIEVHCKGQLIVEKQLLHSRVTASSVHIGIEGNPNGKVIGGDFHLGKFLHAGEIGAPAGSQMHINFNYWLEQLSVRQQLVQEKLANHKSVIGELKETIEYFEEIKNEEDVRDVKEQAYKEKEIHEMTCRKYTLEWRKLEHKRKVILQHAHVEAKSKLYQGIHIKVGEKAVVSTREYGPCKVAMKEHELTFIV
ncbi:DUF342 domain-containing protein [Algicola sagamiensis]|uniref:DUF342 domain-containing protein n=1 Tax=Algicola sagamiensis TaxID=163869 RepID=UPI00037E8D07|nr:FapA family protein [Algicola sagamiensis]